MTDKAFTVYISREDELEPTPWAVAVSDGDNRPIGEAQAASAYDVMIEVAKIIDKAAVPA